MANPWMVFLQKHRQLNPNLSPIEAAKSASKLYKVANKNVSSTLGKTMSLLPSSSKSKKRGKARRGTKRRR
jgi:hypothetical protein